MWNMPESNKKTTLIQCWFPGVHVNIGGRSEDGLEHVSKGDLEMMANTTFAWMVDRCRVLLRFEERVLNHIMAEYFSALEKLTTRHQQARKTDPKLGEVNHGWGIGPYQKDFKGIMNWASVEVVRTPGHYTGEPDTREYIHTMVFHAQQLRKYTSFALDGFDRVSNGEGQGYS